MSNHLIVITLDTFLLAHKIVYNIEIYFPSKKKTYSLKFGIILYDYHLFVKVKWIRILKNPIKKLQKVIESWVI